MLIGKIKNILALFRRVSVPEEMKPAFNRRITQIGEQSARILTALSAVLFMGSYLFDLVIVEPRYHHVFLLVRIAGTGVCLILFAIAKSGIGTRHGIALSSVTLISVGLFSSILVHILGYDHSYYAMLDLIYLGAMVVPMSGGFCFGTCVIIFLFYLLPVFFFSKGTVDPGILANNAGFQLETIIIAVLFSHFHTRKRERQIINEQLITDQRDQISRNLIKINALQESRQQFIQNITHDLKTPLSIIAGHVDLISSKGVSPGDESATTFHYMVDAVNQSTRLLDQLTSIAMIDSGEMVSALKAYEYTEFIRWFSGRFMVLQEKHGVSFEVIVSPEPLVVRMDLLWMERIIGNLIQNAFQHSREGGSIYVRVYHAGEMVVTEVEDTGCGIEVSNLPLVFERKYQAADADQSAGFGLGLNIVRDMVRRMDGEITVRSVVGKGSVFTFTIPCVDVQAEPSVYNPFPELREEHIPVIAGDGRSSSSGTAPAVDTAVEEIQNGGRNEQSTVLLCEDTPGQLYLLVEALKKDYTLLVARNGEEGLKLADMHRDRIDLIISDVRMPVMDGIEFCRRFFQDESRMFIPFILLTAYTNEQEHFKGLALGATDYLQKPFNERILREKINHWILRRKHEQLLEEMINELAQKNELVSRFRSIVSHEIRNPLTALYGVEHYIQLLREELFDSFTENQKQNWTRVEKALVVAESITEILDSIKTLEGSVNESSCRPEPVGEIVRGIMDQIHYVVVEQEVVLENSVPPDTRVVCDSGMVRQVLVNLLKNATEAVRDARRPGTVSLNVHTREDSLVLSVRDTGVGMSNEQKNNLFKYHATTKKDGNGIGLYLCLKLLQLQKGSIVCDSAVDKGTTFTVRLPLAA